MQGSSGSHTHEPCPITACRSVQTFIVAHITRVKLTFHDADTGTDSTPTRPTRVYILTSDTRAISSRVSSRGCRCPCRCRCRCRGRGMPAYRDKRTHRPRYVRHLWQWAESTHRVHAIRPKARIPRHRHRHPRRHPCEDRRENVGVSFSLPQEYSNFRNSRVSDVSARILARMSVSVSGRGGLPA